MPLKEAKLYSKDSGRSWVRSTIWKGFGELTTMIKRTPPPPLPPEKKRKPRVPKQVPEPKAPVPDRGVAPGITG